VFELEADAFLLPLQNPLAQAPDENVALKAL
jgi:hypothetical protein